MVSLIIWSSICFSLESYRPLLPLHRRYNVVINWCHKSVINSSRASVISEIKNAINWKDTCLCIMSIGESSARDIIRSDNIHSSSCPHACYTLASLIHIPLLGVKWTRVFARNVKNSLLLIKRWLSSAFRRILKFIKHIARDFTINFRIRVDTTT